MLLQMALFHSLLWLSSIPLFRYATASLSFICQWTFKLLPWTGEQDVQRGSRYRGERPDPVT